jgi:cation diffusion facilitator CzcD-associated flavoprotein CzcO
MKVYNAAILGTGFGGLGMALRLREQGETDFVILEKAAGVGGTWRDNTYPGAACDVRSHLYWLSFTGQRRGLQDAHWRVRHRRVRADSPE